MSKNWRHNLGKIAGFIIPALCGNQVTASTEFQDLESLKQSVRQAIMTNVGSSPYTNLQISIRSIDNRLRLKSCENALSANVTNPTLKLGRITTMVECNDASSWKIYVQATATADMQIPVLISTMARGAIVGSQDVHMLSVPMGQQTQPIVESIDDLVGMELRRPISSGQPILISQVAAPDVVKRGQKVSIRYDNPDMTITMSGKALKNAAKGDWVSVENTSSGRQVEGRVEKDGTILIPGY